VAGLSVRACAGGFDGFDLSGGRIGQGSRPAGNAGLQHGLDKVGQGPVLLDAQRRTSFRRSASIRNAIGCFIVLQAGSWKRPYRHQQYIAERHHVMIAAHVVWQPAFIQRSIDRWRDRTDDADGLPVQRAPFAKRCCAKLRAPGPILP
jgi:hypothetical protein